MVKQPTPQEFSNDDFADLRRRQRIMGEPAQVDFNRFPCQAIPDCSVRQGFGPK
jgi:hypothetical protein